MAKYCTICGKKLKEKEVCDCKQNNKISSKEIINSLQETVKGIFVKPIDTIKNKCKEKNFIPSMILIGIMSIITGLFITALFKNSIELFNQINTLRMYTFSPLYLDVPYIKIFIITVIVTFALSFAYIGILYLVNTTIFKGRANYKTIYSLYGVTSIVVTASLVLATVLSFVNIGVSLIVLVLGVFLNLVYMYHGIKFIGPKDENKHAYIYLITNILYFIVVSIITELFM
ncbi:MAG: YIP1 family protein [Bacilli bacterium]|nr:YIP1 family protein [Bacilli bacterium]